MLRIGFDVPVWRNKNPKDFTNEELIEYYFKLRLVSKSGPVDSNSSGTDLYLLMLQQEIIERMNK